MRTPKILPIEGVIVAGKRFFGNYCWLFAKKVVSFLLETKEVDYEE